MSLICRSIQNIPCNHTDLLLHFLKFFFLDYCWKTLLQQRNSIKSSVSQVPLKFSLIKTNHFTLRFLRQGFNLVCLLLVRTLWHNFGYFDQQIFRIWISNDWIFFVQEKLGKFREIRISLQSDKVIYLRDELWSRARFVSHT